MKRARLLDLGRRPYREVLTLQREIHRRVARGEDEETWIVVEHHPVITLGRNAKRENVLLSAPMLVARGIELVDVERGGDVTYHGPGQVVVYPIVRLTRFREVVPFVSTLETAVIDTLALFKIRGHRRSEHRGVYVGLNGISAVGLAVKQMTTLHGLSVNVAAELDYNRLITPCGTPQFGITSMSRERGVSIAREAVLDALLSQIAIHFTIEFTENLEHVTH